MRRHIQLRNTTSDHDVPPKVFPNKDVDAGYLFLR